MCIHTYGLRGGVPDQQKNGARMHGPNRVLDMHEQNRDVQLVPIGTQSESKASKEACSGVCVCVRKQFKQAKNTKSTVLV